MKVKVKNILVVLPTVAREGITVLALNQVQALRLRGFKVFIVVLSSYSDAVLEETIGDYSRQNVLILEQKNSYLSVKNLLASPYLIKSLSLFIKEKEVEIVLAHAPYAHFVMRMVKTAAPFFGLQFRLLQYFHATQFAQFPLNSIGRHLFSNFNRGLAKFTDDIHISVSNAVKEDVLENFYKHKLHVVLPNALPDNIKSMGDFKSVVMGPWLQKMNAGFKIVVPGRLSQAKGQLFFLDVICSFIKQVPNIEELVVVIAGDGPDRAEIVKRIEQYKLQGTIHLSGELPKHKLLDLMVWSDVVVVPSFYEGFGLVALEALQQKCLVLTSDAGGLSEVVEHRRTGFVFRTGDVTDCLHKLIYIYENREKLLLDYNEVVIKLEQKFSYKAHINQLVGLLNCYE